MSDRNLLLRLEPALYERLRQASALTGLPVEEVVRGALREYVPGVAERSAADGGSRFRRLRSIAQQQGYLEEAIETVAESEVESPDLLEDAATLHDAPH